ncbi:zinc-binding dehydrogenase [Streptomyces sp. NBC_00457]|uniref:zinc-binding dehydrogenase n=1 Tax=Streptomyces sp. NBC_00457 TaxID=2975748 RepID=UPI002E250434
MAASLTQAERVIAVDVNPGRLALATELGATDTIDAAATDDPVAAIRELTGGGAGHVLESSGNVRAFRQAIDIVNSSKRIVGIVEGASVPHVLIPDLIGLHAAGRFPVERLVTSFSFSRINDAAAVAASGEAVKPVLHL